MLNSIQNLMLISGLVLIAWFCKFGGLIDKKKLKGPHSKSTRANMPKTLNEIDATQKSLGANIHKAHNSKNKICLSVHVNYLTHGRIHLRRLFLSKT